jgi:hypothetical protein
MNEIDESFYEPEEETLMTVLVNKANLGIQEIIIDLVMTGFSFSRTNAERLINLNFSETFREEYK